ncbi:unnamed protein product, partial [marine sediment metagenome]
GPAIGDSELKRISPTQDEKGWRSCWCSWDFGPDQSRGIEVRRIKIRRFEK